MHKKISAKVCLLGDGAVGKTSLIKRFVLDTFDDNYLQTIGTKISKKEINLNMPDSNLEVDLKLLIWDIMGQTTATRLKELYFRESRGALIVCDMTRKKTLDHLEGWIKSLHKVTGNVPIIVLGNKADLVSEYEFEEFDVQHLSKQYNSTFFLTSAKTGQNVEEAFTQLGELLVRRPGKAPPGM